jgi:hypothetical protein
MKLVGVAFALLLASAALARQEGPVNKTCPIMKGKACKPGVTSTYEGKVVGFC